MINQSAIGPTADPSEISQSVGDYAAIGSSAVCTGSAVAVEVVAAEPANEFLPNRTWRTNRQN